MANPKDWSIWLFPLCFLLVPLTVELAFRKRRRIFRALMDLKKNGKKIETAELTSITQHTCDVCFTVTRKINDKYQTERITALTIVLPKSLYNSLCEEYGDPTIEYEHIVVDSTSNMQDNAAIEISGHSDTAGLCSVDSTGHKIIDNVRVMYDTRDVCRFVFGEEMDDLGEIGWWIIDAIRHQPWRLLWLFLSVCSIWVWPILGFMSISSALTAMLGGMVLAGMVSSLVIWDSDTKLRAMFKHDCMTEILSIHEKPLFTHRFSFGSCSMEDDDAEEEDDDEDGDDDNDGGEGYDRDVNDSNHAGLMNQSEMRMEENEVLVSQYINDHLNDTSEHSITTSHQM